MLTVGAAGGPKIITQVVLTIVRQIDLGQSLPDAVGRPRFHHQWRPNVVTYEKDLADGYIDGLRQRGHALDEIDSGGITRRSPSTMRKVWRSATRAGSSIGVSDPRGYGKAAGDSDSRNAQQKRPDLNL